ncbi:MAG: response regulator transcription factor [Acidimicrobiia bacterium]|nr:response regulator transcription factor [Acidimicrobiia bacterium]
MTAAGRVLIVEDDEAVRDAVERGLALNGFTVGSVPDAEQALASVAKRRPDLLVVDVGLPGMSGVDLCTRLRQLGIDVPVLILSALDQVGDRVAGLEAGADDYLVKPFDLQELTLRLQALLRRSVAAEAAASVALTCGPLWIDPDRRLASLDGVALELSRREFDLLSAFATNPGIVLSRLRLLELVWGYDFDSETNVVDVFVGYLRRKLEADGHPRMIHTVRGVGFVLRAP